MTPSPSITPRLNSGFRARKWSAFIAIGALSATLAVPLSTASAASATIRFSSQPSPSSVKLPATSISTLNSMHRVTLRASTVRESARRDVSGPVNVSDPTLLFQTPSSWNNSGGAFYLKKADLNNTKENVFRQFHSAAYAPGLLANGECGDNSQGKPNPKTCSGVGGGELSPIAPSDTVQLSLWGSLYKSVANAHSWLMDSHSYILSHFKGEKANPCTFSNGPLPNCYIYGFSFENSSNQVTAYGYFVELQVQNILGEGLDVVSAKDNANKTKGAAFGNDLFGLLANENAVFTLNTTNSKKQKILATDPLAADVPFQYWPLNDSAAAFALVQPADADNANLNPMGQFHTVNKKVATYTAAGMLNNGSCGVDNKGKALPKKCGGFLEIADSPIAQNKTFKMFYLGTIYRNTLEAAAQLKNSLAASGTACPFTASNGKPFPGCMYTVLAATGQNNAKLDLLYGVVTIQNGLAEVMAIVNASDFKSKTTGPVITGAFFNVLFGGWNSLYSASHPAPPPAKMAAPAQIAPSARPLSSYVSPQGR